MPIYDYECQHCAARMEKIQKINDAALVDCPECGQSSLKKVVTAGNFRLKGDGWYETDFKTGKKKNVVSDSSSS